MPTSTTDATLGSGITPNLIIDAKGAFVGFPVGVFDPALLRANSLTISTVNPFKIDGALFSVNEFFFSLLTLTSGDLTRQDVAGAEGDHVIDASVLLASDGLWNVSGAGKLIVSSIAESGGSRTFTKTGAGTLQSSLNVTGAKTVSQGTFKGSLNGAGMATFESGAVFDASGISNSNITLTGLNGSFLFTALKSEDGDSAQINGQIILADNLAISPQTNSAIVLMGGITDNGMNKGFLMSGSGLLQLFGPGLFSGNVSLFGEGEIQVGHNTALGAGVVRLTDSGPGNSEIPTLALLDGITFSNPINIRSSRLGVEKFSTAATNATVVSNISLEGLFAPETAFLDAANANDTLTVSGNISEAFVGSIVKKTGNGKVILSGNNSFTGGLTVEAGELVAAANAALPAGPPTVIQAGARLGLQGNQTLTKPLQLFGAGPEGLGSLRSNSGDNTWAGSIALGANASVGATAGNVLTISGPVTGAFGLSKVDEGTLRLTNSANNYTSLTIADGTLSLGSHEGIPVGVPLNVSAGGSVSLLNSTSINRTLNLNGAGNSATVAALDNEAGDNSWAGPVILQSASTMSARADSLTVTGNISGAFPLSKVGAGVLALAGSNSHGDTSIEQGVLLAQSGEALPSGRTVTVGSGATLQVGNGVTTNATASLRLNGPGSAGLGAISIAQGSGTFAGPLTLVTDTTIGAASGTTLMLAGQVSDDAVPLPLVKVGPGTLALAAANTYRGGTFANSGVLSVSSNVNLGDPAGAVTLNNGAKLLITANTTTGRTFHLNTGSVQVDAGVTLTYDGAIVNGGFLRGPGTHAISGQSANLSGVTALPGSNLTQSSIATLNNFNNSGSLISNAALIWDGGYNTGAGHVIVNSTLNLSAFENNGVVTVNNGATLSNSGNDLVSSGGSRIIVNSGGAIELNSSSLNLHGALIVNNGTISGTTNVHFGSLAKGTGSYGTVNVFDGGVYAPGNSPGLATAATVIFDNSPFSGGGPTLQIELAGTTQGTEYDHLDVSGQLSLGGTLKVALIDGFAPVAGQSFDLLDWGSLSGTFSAIQLPTLSGLAWNTSQLYTTGVLSLTAASRPGDFDLDGDVDGRDFLVWQRGGSPNPVSAGDLADWKANFGDPLPASANSTAVPEPSALVCSLVTLLGFAIRQRQ
ncbi:beta strand repeat-containing protein [Lacipirellula limnantheis]|uniref:beta strand repeat-containing protein n=1 Tax=Lacipirellula limnantheis TaxID=2528024 RepID=UPI00143D6958|nr:autotransporter-associated beta strand repeat-containing protein [Lacipirellula limnantheis]